MGTILIYEIRMLCDVKGCGALNVVRDYDYEECLSHLHTDGWTWQTQYQDIFGRPTKFIRDCRCPAHAKGEKCEPSQFQEPPLDVRSTNGFPRPAPA